MSRPLALLLVVKGIVYMLWPITAMAAGLTLAETVHTTPLLAWLLVILMSAMSGLTSLLNRIKDTMPERLVMFCAGHMLGSVLSGVLAFAVCEMTEVPGWGQLVAVIVASYGGAEFVDRMSRRYIDRQAARVEP